MENYVFFGHKVRMVSCCDGCVAVETFDSVSELMELINDKHIEVPIRNCMPFEFDTLEEEEGAFGLTLADYQHKNRAASLSLNQRILDYENKRRVMA